MLDVSADTTNILITIGATLFVVCFLWPLAVVLALALREHLRSRRLLRERAAERRQGFCVFRALLASMLVVGCSMLDVSADTTTNTLWVTNHIPVISSSTTITRTLTVTNTVLILVTNPPSVPATNPPPVVIVLPVTNPPPVIITNHVPRTNFGLRLEFEIQPRITAIRSENPQGLAISTGQVTVEGDWQFGPNGALHFRFNSAHYGADQGARIVTWPLPAPDGAWHKITAEYDLQFVTIKRDGVIVVRDWLDSQTTEIPGARSIAPAFNTPIRNITATPFAVTPLLPEVRWQGNIGNSSVPNHGPSMWATFFPANAMCTWGDYIFVCFGFNEAFPELVRFHKNNPQATDLQFGMRHLATLDEVRVPVDLAIGSDNLLYVKRANGLVTKFDPNTGKALTTLIGSAIPFPATAPRPVPLPDQTWNVAGKIVGEPGGYANGTDIKLTRFGHWFIDGRRIPRTAACYQTDGKAWLSDSATCRLMRFKVDGSETGGVNWIPDGTVIHWTPHSYVMAVDKNNRRRVFNRFLEYLDGVPVRFYGNDPDVTFGFGEGFSSVATINGETLATMILTGGQSRQVVKLDTAGITLTGRGIEKFGLLEKDGSLFTNTRVVDGVAYTFQPLGVPGFHLKAERAGTVLWQSMPTGDNTGNGTFDLRCEGGAQTAANGCIAVAGPYVITALKMEFWKTPRSTGQGNQLFIHDKATGKFLRQFGLPLMHRGEIDHAPGAASNIFSLDAWENPDGTLTVISNDEWGKGAQVWKIGKAESGKAGNTP